MARLLPRISALGSAAQAAVPGLYAWAVTVAPVITSRSSPVAAKFAGAAGLLALVAGVLLEPRMGPRARYVSVWGLVLTSAVAWMASPGALTPLRLDAPRGLAGMAGWALFAFASAAPALKPDNADDDRVLDGPALRPRSVVKRGDLVFVAVGIVAAVMLQAVGWRVVAPERALLVRAVTLAAGLAVLGAATSIALARHTRPAPRPTRLRLRSGLPWLVVLVLLGATGGVVLLRG